jgi:cytochrome c oxidase subunit 2
MRFLSRARCAAGPLALLCFLLLAETTGAQDAAAPGGAPANAAPAPTDPAAARGIWPEVISTYGQEVDNLFYLILGITLVALVAVQALLVLFMVKYRHRDGRRATFVHGSKRLEIIWTVATAGILVFIAIVQRSTWAKIKYEVPGPEAKPFLVRVFGEQFVWHFNYSGADGRFEPWKMEDIFPGVNPLGLAEPEKDFYSPSLIVPVNVPVVLEIHSLPKFDQTTQKPTLGVLHSFYVPELRLKQDLVPGYPGRIWFEATKTGTFELACAELCGLGHYTMRADFKVLGAEDLKKALGYDWQAVQATFD